MHRPVDGCELALAARNFTPTAEICSVKNRLRSQRTQDDIAQLNLPCVLLQSDQSRILKAFRIVGKVGGAYLGSKMMHSYRSIQRYLGICLLPQAGVALGMAYQAKSDFGENGITILIVVLIATLVYELFGPIGVKIALERANEIREH